MIENQDELSANVERYTGKVNALKSAIGQVVVGQRGLIDRLLLALFADGHVLVEGLPGLAKTTAIKSVADAVNASFSRVQFTPDLLPADLVGTEIYRPKSGEFMVKRGPVFTNLLLADEINRAPAKVQSALLEAMAERQVTLGDETTALPDLFLVLATQNPIEQEGTYPLPEAQTDRFMLKVLVDYPSRQEEREIMKRISSGLQGSIDPVLSTEEVLQVRQLVNQIYLDEKLEEYIIALVFATRDPGSAGLPEFARMIQIGASPRASIYLHRASKAMAFLNGRSFVTPADVKSVAPDVLRHRIHLSYEAEAKDMTSDEIINTILQTVDVP